MLNTSQFFSSLVNQYVSRYNRIAEQFGAPAARSSSGQSPSAQTSPTTSPISEVPRQDRAVLAQSPTLEAPSSDTRRATQDRFEPQKRLSDANQTPLAPAESESSEKTPEKPDPATYSSSFTNLRYGLKLKFDMQAIQRTVQQLSVTQDSESTTTDESFEQLFAGGFGFSADLKLSGISINSTLSDSGRGVENYRRQETIQHARGLQHEAAQTKESLPSDSRQSYQVAVNRFSLRYKTDTRFSFSHFSRFQSHVEQLNGQKPNAVDAYTNQVGQLAQGASNAVVGQFFDTVDGYLQNKEESLIANAERFFDMAAESLGLSAEALKLAKTSITGTIEGFFDSVETSLDGLQSQFSRPVAIDNPVTPTQAPITLDGARVSPPAQAPAEDKHSLLSDLISIMQSDADKEATEAVKKAGQKETQSREKLRVSA